MQTIFTPWRYAYITASHPAQEGCFLCRGAGSPDDPQCLVVHVAEHHLVMLNRFPYSSGHLMVAARHHLASPALASRAAQEELWPLVVRAQGVLQELFRPHGFNLGMNVGQVAGAGVPDHYHFHVVPRWQADTNFMTVVGDVRLIPDDLESMWSRVRQAFAAQEG